MVDDSGTFPTAGVLGRAFRSGELSPVAVTRELLERIDRLNPALGAVHRLCPERAMAEAAAAERAFSAGEARSPLQGVPYLVKDLFDVAGLPTTAGTRLLEDNVAEADSTAVARLAAAGMVLLGKTVTVQFAYGGAGVNHDHGTPRNPWRQDHYLPGGSSSGSAVAVAAGLAPLALGSDTGGSVRIPASLCGITGLKTTVGRISRAGVYPLSWSLDSVGPLARSVEDAARVYQLLAGADPGDETTLGRPAGDVLAGLEDGLDGLKIGIPENVFWEEVDAEVAEAVLASADVLRSLGARVERMAFPAADGARLLNPRGLVIAAEAYAVNRRFMDDHYDELDPVVATRMIQGKGVAAADYIENLLQWQALRVEAMKQMAGVDALICPSTMIPATPLADCDCDLDRYVERNLAYLRNTSIGNVLNLCGLSVPCGFTAAGLPIGAMICGSPFAEATVLRIGHAYQRATDWHQRVPPLDWAAGVQSS
ncbi:MAG TPA: amidase [Pseudomonadales bacterium]|jgi:aspartyl-tRNA(Asn)/glutamyl-tRNA(Gln) amidotransferase subunit A